MNVWAWVVGHWWGIQTLFFSTRSLLWSQICGGVVLASMTEASFNWPGFISAMGRWVFGAARAFVLFIIAAFETANFLSLSRTHPLLLS